jgi:hypothetical protein
MAINTSVAAGKIDQTTSSVWLPCVKVTGWAFFAASYFQRNQNSARLVMTKITPSGSGWWEQAVDHAAVGVDILGEPMPCMGTSPPWPRRRLPRRRPAYQNTMLKTSTVYLQAQLAGCRWG